MGDQKVLVNSTRLRAALLGGSILALAYMPSGAMAQEERSGASAPTQSEIIVTARKRDETAIDVPAAITALGAEDLDRYGTRDFSGLQKQVPGLMIADIPSNSGGAIALRGLSSSPNNPAIDQTVAINIDGVQVGSGAIIRLGQIDIQQVEVLKGPQALFFGKNSPAGVVSFRSADPGDSLEVKGSVDYEFNAREWGGQVAVGGPLTETLGARIAIAGNKMKGWIKNNAQVIPGFTFAPPTSRSPDKEEFVVRGTLVFKPTAEFTARLKYTYSHMTADSDIFTRQQRIACPYGTPQGNGYPGTIDCKADDVTTNGGQDPRLIALVTPFIPDYLNGGEFKTTGQKAVQHLASLELNYEVAPDITVTSVSGYYKIDDFFSGTAMYQSAGGLVAMHPSTRKELSQEIRLVTAKDDWPVNLAMGAYYQDTKIFNAVVSAIDLYGLTKGASSSPGAACGACSESDYNVNGKTLSAFGQVIVKPIEQIEIAGGVRYTNEKKDVSARLNGLPKADVPGLGAPYTASDVEYSNWSPEITVRYRPNQDWTVFGAWRNGFKSGGFNTGNGQAAPSVRTIDYRPEKTKGFEAGVKYSNGRFSANLTAYTYKYKDLQVETFDPISLSRRLINAATSTIKGIEGDFQWRTPLDGLELRGSFNYNKARYGTFLAGCYAGQLVSEGCNLTPTAALAAAIAGGFDPNGVVPFPAGARYQNQDLGGRPLVLAPDWTGSLGFSYTTPVGNSLEIGFSSDAMYSSSFFGQLESAPQGKQEKYVNLDGSIFVGAQDGTWRLALMGRNLTEVYRSRFVSQTPLTGIATRAGTNIPGGLPDFSGNVNRGREIRIQGSFKF